MKRAYLIIGPSGSGKTTIGRELRRLGYRVVDADREFAYFGDRVTGEAVIFPGNAGITEEWYRSNGWIWRGKDIERAVEGSREIIFLVGGAENEATFYHRFRVVFLLRADPRMLRERLSARDDSNPTKNRIWIERSLGSDTEDFGSERPHRLVPIETGDRSVAEAVREILAHVDEPVTAAAARQARRVAKRLRGFVRSVAKRLTGTWTRRLRAKRRPPERPTPA